MLQIHVDPITLDQMTHTQCALALGADMDPVDEDDDSEMKLVWKPATTAEPIATVGTAGRIF